MDRHQANSVHASSRDSGSTCPDKRIIQRALAELEEHFHFRRHLQGIELNSRSGELCIRGNLPSYYLKQLLQTILREIPGVTRINNQIAVVSSTGLSDCP